LYIIQNKYKYSIIHDTRADRLYFHAPVRVNGIKGSIAKRILLQNAVNQQTAGYNKNNEKNGDGEQEHHLEEAEWE
jgi:hypothetical protein